MQRKKNFSLAKGDSGGPLVFERSEGSYELAGVTSFGLGCAVPGVPAVYASVMSEEGGGEDTTRPATQT